MSADQEQGVEVAGEPGHLGDGDGFAPAAGGRGEAGARQAVRGRVLAVVLGLALPVVGLTVWQVLTDTGILNATFFPAPSSIAAQMGADVTSARSLALLLGDLGVTVGVLAVGFGIGAAAGLVIGVAMGVSRVARFTFSPTLYVVYALPMIALYPLALILLGLGDWSTIGTCALGTFFVVCISALGGVSGRNPLYDELVRVFRVNRRVRYTQVIVPGALPAIMSGLKLGLAQALIIVLSIEFIGSTTGMGAYIWNAWQALEVGQMFVGLFAVLVLAGVIVILGTAVERIGTPWARR
jgi:ABC-type nitrate/sulfonate/bicarbonate transport system permease component